MAEEQTQEAWTPQKQLEHLKLQQAKAQEAVVKLQGAIELMEGVVASQTPPGPEETPAEPEAPAE
jgi:hypothetical protein